MDCSLISPKGGVKCILSVTAVDCGPTSDESFLKDAAAVIREQYMALAPDDPNFSMLALCQA